MARIDASRILIVCQGAGREPFTSETVKLFKSLNIFGGKLSLATKIAFFTEPVETKLEQRLAELGVKVRIVENTHNRFVHANKVQILRLVQDEDFDLLISLDTDIVITNDFSNQIHPSWLGAKPDDIVPLDMEEWKNIFQYFGVQFPTERCYTTLTMTKTIPYFNSGVLIIPKTYVNKLYDLWQSFVLKVVNAYDKISVITKNSYYTDQIALSLAIQHGKFSFYALPLSMNFPTHVGIHKSRKPEKSKSYLVEYGNDVSQIQPLIIHYHHRVTNLGNIRHCYYENVNKIIDQINLSLYNTTNQLSYNKLISESTTITDWEMIVDDMYIDILHRPADKGGLGYFASLLASYNTTIIDVRKILLNSDEYKALLTSDKTTLKYDVINEESQKQSIIGEEPSTIIDELYTEILHRPADSNGLQYYGSLLENGKLTISELRKTLLNSDEYRGLLASEEMTLGYGSINEEQLKRVFPHDDDVNLLLNLVNTSRKYIGWFTKHVPHMYEYPWIVNQISDIDNKVMLDIGTGISPIPLFLAEKGAKIITIDSHHVIRKLDQDRHYWNEWGFFDYSVLNENIKSLNESIEKINFSNDYFDCVYSISTIEHMPAITRQKMWKSISKWIKRNGQLVLTIDLIRNTENLWNYGEKEMIESIEEHGNLNDVKKEISLSGFELVKCNFLRNLPSIYKVDCALMLFKKL